MSQKDLYCTDDHASEKVIEAISRRDVGAWTRVVAGTKREADRFAGHNLEGVPTGGCRGVQGEKFRMTPGLLT